MRDGDLRNIFRKQLPQVHFQPIEIGGTGHGVPDVNFCYKSIEGFIEFKMAKGGKIGLRPEQIGWIKERIRYGGLVKICVRAYISAEDYLIMFKGDLVNHLETQTLQNNFNYAVNFWKGGPREWNWAEILQALILRD